MSRADRAAEESKEVVHLRWAKGACCDMVSRFWTKHLPLPIDRSPSRGVAQHHRSTIALCSNGCFVACLGHRVTLSYFFVRVGLLVKYCV